MMMHLIHYKLSKSITRMKKRTVMKTAMWKIIGKAAILMSMSMSIFMEQQKI